MKSSAWSYRLYGGLWGGLDWLFPPVCGGCGKKGYRWCEECRRETVPIPRPLCDICGLPQMKTGICPTCQASRPPFIALRSWSAFEGPVRNALHRLKYRRDLGLGDALAGPLAEFAASQAWPIDVAIPVPLSRQRLRERGYNQIGLVAFPLSLCLGLRYAPNALMRTRHTRSQVGLAARERRANVQNAFQGDQRHVSDSTVLLMDDVATTGSTLAAAAAALMQAGARGVYCLTLARALPRHGLETA